MSVYEATITVKVSGEPDTTYSFCHPDEGCLVECMEAFQDLQSQALAYRKANAHDKMLAAAGCQCHTAGYRVVCTRDGHPHMRSAGSIEDLPAAAVAHLKGLVAAYLATPCVAGCRKP